MHLASRGFVVAAPEHTGNTAFDIPPVSDVAGRRDAHRLAVRRRPADLVAVFRALTAPRTPGTEASRWPRCRADAVGVAGHSFGGWTALKLAAQRVLPVAAVFALAPAGEPFVGRNAFTVNELPLPGDCAALLIASDLDVLVDLETSVIPMAQLLGSNSRLVVMRNTDHYHYCDSAEEIHNMRRDDPTQSTPSATGKVSLPFEQLVSEARAHRILKDAAAALFLQALVARTPPGQVLSIPFDALDPCLQTVMIGDAKL